MGKHNEKPELEMFTILNPEFYGVPEEQFTTKTAKENSTDFNPGTKEGK